VDADELTYHMHIFIRYEIEQLIFRDGVPVADLPEHWNRLYLDYLGVAPPNDALGILQDVHWSCGLFGYFPTYTLGTLMSHQFFDQALLEIEGLEDDIKAGQFGRFSVWLKDKIHCHGRGKTAKELVMDICGEDISEVSFLNYLTAKYLS
jgi:carboxypeptidase Taq